ALVRAIDLHVVLHLAWLLQLGIELLSCVAQAWPTTRTAAVSVTPVGFEQVAPAVGEHNRDIAAAVERDRSHETLLPQMPKVTLAWVQWPTVVVAQVPRRDDAEAADNAQRAGFGPAKDLLPVAIADPLTFESARQVELIYEGVSRIDRATIAGVIVPFPWVASPARIIVEHTPETSMNSGAALQCGCGHPADA